MSFIVKAIGVSMWLLPLFYWLPTDVAIFAFVFTLCLLAEEERELNRINRKNED